MLRPNCRWHRRAWLARCPVRHCQLTTVVACIALLGCSSDAEVKGGQTGDEGSNQYQGPGHADQLCDWIERQIEPDDETLFGVTAGELLEPFLSPVSTSLEWLDYGLRDAAQTPLSYRPGPSSSSISLRLQAREGAIREFEDRPFRDTLAEERMCNSGHYEIPVTVVAETQEGALDASFDSYLTVSSRRLGYLSHEIPLDENQGDFAWLSDEVRFKDPGFAFHARLWQDGSAGELRPRFGDVVYLHGEPRYTGGLGDAGTAQAASSEPTAQAPVEVQVRPYALESNFWTVAAWPTGLVCDVGATALSSDAAVFGASARDVMDAIRDVELAIESALGDSGPLSMTFESVGEHICAYLGRDILSFWVDARIAGAALGLDASLHLQIRAETNLEGELTSINLTRYSSESLPSAASALEAQLGFVVEGAAAYEELYWTFQGTYVSSDSDWSASGELLVYGAPSAGRGQPGEADASVSASGPTGNGDAAVTTQGNDAATARGHDASDSGGAESGNGLQGDADRSEWPTPPRDLLYRATWSG